MTVSVAPTCPKVVHIHPSCGEPSNSSVGENFVPLITINEYSLVSQEIQETPHLLLPSPRVSKANTQLRVGVGAVYSILIRVFRVLGRKNRFVPTDRERRETMDKKQLKKILAGFSVASLLAGSTLTLYGCATKGKTSCSGTGSCSGTKQEGTETSCSGKTSCSGTKGKTSCS